MVVYGCKIEGCDYSPNNKQVALKHVIEVHKIPPKEAENYIIQADTKEEYLKIKEEMYRKEREEKNKGAGDALDAELRAMLESTMKQLLDRQKSLESDFTSFKERLERIEKFIESLQPSLQPQSLQPQARQPQVTVDVLEGDYIPIAKKVFLNPRVLMYYQYARSQGYGGDLGDFINEVIESFFRDRRIKIAVLKGVSELEWGKEQG